MKYLNIMWIAILAMGLWSCEFESYSEYRTPEYDGAFSWTEVTRSAGWSNRWDHTSLYYNDRLWIIGGYNPGAVSGDTYLEDVWSSGDGKSWKLETASAPWLGRRGHASVVFDNGTGPAIYVIGGFAVNEETGYREYRNDVWRSVDGQNWREIKESTRPGLDSLYDWFPRFNHCCVTANHGGTDYIYLIGGYTMLEDHDARYAPRYFNDVWRSADGISWDRMPNNDFGIRAEHAAVVDPSTGRIYLQGGRNGVMIQDSLNSSRPNPEWQWLWSSDDGINWIPENDTAEFNQSYLYRAEHRLVLMDDRLFGFPGRNASNVHFHFSEPAEYTFWRMDPGNLWTVDSEGSDFGARYGYSVAVHNEKVWILGGDTNSKGPSNDVWLGEIK
jgi:hypothetical protein